MIDPSLPISTAPRNSWRMRAKASLFGGIAATVAVPLLMIAAVPFAPPTESGVSIQPSDILPAIPAIWVFAGAIILPVSLLLGPLLLAAAARMPRAVILVAALLGATLGVAVVNALHVAVLLSAEHSPVGWALSTFCATIGALGAGAAATLSGKAKSGVGRADAA
jgi:hypothetical protein